MSDEVEYEMTLNNPSLPKGAEIQILGLGVFENGRTYQISKDEAQGFRTYHTRQVEVTDDSGAVVGSEPELGDTLLQASKSMYGVEVNTSNSGNNSKPQQKNTPTASQQQPQQQNPVKAPQVEADKATDQTGGDK